MNKKIYSALALSLFVVGCSQEELAPNANQIETGEQNLESVVGHDLVGPISISIANADATRAANGSWEANDKLGLAWFNIETSGITVEQTAVTFDVGLTNATDEIYGNHLFSVAASGAFETQTNVYQGAHFVYWPFERATKVEKKSVDLNAVAYEGAVIKDLDNVAFRMSPVDFISAADVDANMKLAKKFQLEPVAAAIGLKAAPSELFKGNETLKNLKVASYEVKSATGVTFEPAFDIVTKDLPKAAYLVAPDPNAGELDVASNKAAMETYAQGISATPVTVLTRDVKAGAITLADDMVLPLYTLPVTAPGTPVAPSNFTVTINIVTASGLTGYFTIDNPTDVTTNPDKNQAAINKLTTAVNTASGALTKITRNGAGVYTYLGLDVDLAKANFTLNADISNKTEWDDAVAIYNALGGDATFTVDGDVEFTTDVPVLEAGKITVNTTGTGKLIVKGEVDLPAADKLDADAAAIEVASTGELTLANNLVLANGNITNNGIINLGDRSQVGVRTTGLITNNGRINVVYGSYAYVATPTTGTVAYVVPADYETYKINNLISTSNTGGLANVNTLVVGTDVILNLNGTNGGADDPYSGGAAGLSDLSAINIEMAGGSLIKGLGNTHTTVNNVKVVEGITSVINEITIAGDLTAAAATTAQVTSSTLQNDLDNAGTLNLMDTHFTSTSALTNSGTLNVDATKTGTPLAATFTTAAASLNNTGDVKVKDGILTLTIASITNAANAKIEADNIQQVKFTSLANNGTLIRVTQ